MNTICPQCQTTNRIPEERVQDSAKCGRCHHELFEGEVINATKTIFDKIIQDDLPIVVDFWAPWCGPCLNFTPVFEEIAANRSHQVRFVKINTEAEQELGERFRIRSIPTIMLFKQGKMVDILNGALPKASFEQWLDETLSK